jgi:hypothetical protein
MTAPEQETEEITVFGSQPKKAEEYGKKALLKISIERDMEDGIYYMNAYEKQLQEQKQDRKNLIDAVFSKTVLMPPSRIVLLYLIGLKLSGKPMPTPLELDARNLYNLENGNPDAYNILGELSKLGYIKGPSNTYTLDYADLAPLVKPLETNGNAPRTASNIVPSVLQLLKLFYKRHLECLGRESIRSNTDLVVMRGICKTSPKNTEMAIDEFFASIFVKANTSKKYGIIDFRKFLIQKGYITEKFSPKFEEEKRKRK